MRSTQFASKERKTLHHYMATQQTTQT